MSDCKCGSGCSCKDKEKGKGKAIFGQLKKGDPTETSGAPKSATDNQWCSCSSPINNK